MPGGHGGHLPWTVGNADGKVNRMPVTIVKYPDYKEAVKRLVEQHRRTRKNRLHLAVYLAPPGRLKRDIFLFEVLDDFGGGRIDAEKKLFTFAYGSTPGLPLPEGVRLWMILTNPTELDKAIQEDWPRVAEIRKARNAGNALVIHADSKGKRFLSQIA